MTATFKNAWGYQGDAMNLPVADIDASIPFYTDIMGFEVVSRDDAEPRSVVLGRSEIEMALVRERRRPGAGRLRLSGGQCRGRF